MGVEMMVAAAALQAFQGFQAYQAGRSQAKVARQTAEYNASIVQQKSDLERKQLQKQQRLFSGTQAVRAAGSGAVLNSFDDLFESTKQEQLLDLAILDYNSKLERDQIIYSGRVEASQAKQRGVSGLISGLSSAASTGASAYNASKMPKAPSGSTYEIGSMGYDPAKQAPPRKPVRFT